MSVFEKYGAINKQTSVLGTCNIHVVPPVFPLYLYIEENESRLSPSKPTFMGNTSLSYL